MIKVKISFSDEGGELILDPNGSQTDAAKLELLLANHKVNAMIPKDAGAWTVIFATKSAAAE